MLVTNVRFGNASLPLETCRPLTQSPSWDPCALGVSLVLSFRWELVGPVSHCRAGAGVAVCDCLTSQIRDVGHGSTNVVDCM